MLIKFEKYIKENMFLFWGSNREESDSNEYDREKEDAPYGFWILEDGNFYIVRTQNHPETAKQLYKEKYGTLIDPESYYPYFKKGWLRITRQEGWDGKDNNGVYYYDYMKSPNDKQKRSLKEIQIKYKGAGLRGFKVEEDDYI